MIHKTNQFDEKNIGLIITLNGNNPGDIIITF